jgi:hypothetical protein
MLAAISGEEKNFLPSVVSIQLHFHGATAHVPVTISTELSPTLDWSCVRHAVFYGDNIQRMIVVTLAVKLLCIEQG